MASTRWSVGALLQRLLPSLPARAQNRGQSGIVGAPSSQEQVTQLPHEALCSGDAREALRLAPAAEKILLDAGMPPEGSSIYDGPARAADTPEGAARKFVIWARAVGVTGTFTTRTVGALYVECAEADHREPVALDRFLRALKNARGVRLASAQGDPRQQTWTIDLAEPKRVPKPQSQPAKPVAKVAKAAAAAPPKLSPQLAAVLQRYAAEADDSSPQLLRATAHTARRQGRARKQRGSRNVRWAA